MLSRYGGDLKASYLLCALVHCCHLDVQLKSLLGAVPSGGAKAVSADINRSMANLGVAVRSIKFDFKKWAQRPFPVLIENDNDIVILAMDNVSESPVIFDGSSIWKADASKFSDLCSDFWSYDLASTTHPLSTSSRNHTGYTWVRALFDHFPNFIKTVLLYSFFLVIAAVLFPLTITGYFGQMAWLGSAYSYIPMTIGFISIILIESIVFIQRSYLVNWVSIRAEYLINSASFSHIFNVPSGYSEKYNPNSQSARVRSFESIREFFTGPAFSSIIDLPVSFASLIFVYCLSLEAGLVLTCGIIALLSIFMFSWRKSRALTSIAADDATELQRLIIETLDKIDGIRNCGLENVWHSRITNATEQGQQSRARLSLLGAWSEAMSISIYTVIIISLIFAGVFDVWSNSYSASILLILIILGMRILMPFHTLCLSVLRFEQIRRSFKQINSLMDIEVEEHSDRVDRNALAVNGALSFVNAGFKSVDTRPIFVGLDISIQPGELVGVVGANGSGKTTVLRMILGLVAPSLGTIRIGGVDIRQIPSRELRRRIAYIPQRPVLPLGTLRQNLMMSNPLVTEDELTDVLKFVEIEDDIKKLPNELDYKVYSGELSFMPISFVYKFYLAKLILSNCKLMLIDQIPNNILDESIGKIIGKILENKKRKSTIILVSQRQDHLEKMDKIIRLKYGRVPNVIIPAE